MAYFAVCCQVITTEVNKITKTNELFWLKKKAHINTKAQIWPPEY